MSSTILSPNCAKPVNDSTCWRVRGHFGHCLPKEWRADGLSAEQFLEQLLISERPVVEGAGFYAFEFIGDCDRVLHLYVTRDYSNSEFGQWVIDGIVLFP